MAKKFHLDRRNSMIMGVCSGIAEYTGWNAKWIRIGLVAVTLLGAFPWTLVAYAVAAWIAKPAPYYGTGEFLGSGYRPQRASTHAIRSDMRDIDRRMAEVEEYVTSNNSRLAREIEELR